MDWVWCVCGVILRKIACFFAKIGVFSVEMGEKCGKVGVLRVGARVAKGNGL